MKFNGVYGEYHWYLQDYLTRNLYHVIRYLIFWYIIIHHNHHINSKHMRNLPHNLYHIIVTDVNIITTTCFLNLHQTKTRNSYFTQKAASRITVIYVCERWLFRIWEVFEIMMTSSNANIFGVTGPPCSEKNAQIRWIFSWKDQQINRSCRCFKSGKSKWIADVIWWELKWLDTCLMIWPGDDNKKSKHFDD